MRDIISCANMACVYVYISAVLYRVRVRAIRRGGARRVYFFQFYLTCMYEWSGAGRGVKERTLRRCRLKRNENDDKPNLH